MSSRAVRAAKEQPLDAGWQVEVPASKTGESVQFAAGWGVDVQPPKQQAKKRQADPRSGDNKQGKRAKAKGSKKGVYVDLSSPEGMLGMAALKQQLSTAGPRPGVDMAELQQAGASQRRGKKSKLPAMNLQRQRRPQEDEEYMLEDGDGEVSDTPEAQITFSDSGVEYITYDENGFPTVTSDRAEEELEPSLEDFAQFGWEQFGDDDDDVDNDDVDDGAFDPRRAAAAGVGKRGKRRSKQGRLGGAARQTDDEMEARDSAMLRDMTNEDDWGLEEVGGRGSVYQSLVSGSDRRMEHDVQWGGSAAATGIDFEEQEVLLSKFFKPHQVKEYMKQQHEVEDFYADMRRQRSGRFKAEHRTHAQLRIIGGSVSGRMLQSSQGAQTRPMMEKVRAAIFNMITSQAGTVNVLPSGSKWLDLFAGTGSVGLEALSRGCAQCHFVEMDPWVTRKILGKNITACDFKRQSVIHTMKAEAFLRKSLEVPRFAGGAFDFISMCPPYLLVSYPELFDLLQNSQLIHANTILFVEYPKQLSDQIPDTVGPLVRVKERKYGRTLIAVYGPAAYDHEDDDF